MAKGSYDFLWWIWSWWSFWKSMETNGNQHLEAETIIFPGLCFPLKRPGPQGPRACSLESPSRASFVPYELLRWSRDKQKWWGEQRHHLYLRDDSLPSPEKYLKFMWDHHAGNDINQQIFQTRYASCWWSLRWTPAWTTSYRIWLGWNEINFKLRWKNIWGVCTGKSSWQCRQCWFSDRWWTTLSASGESAGLLSDSLLAATKPSNNLRATSHRIFTQPVL